VPEPPARHLSPTVLTTRGRVLAVGAACSAVAGLAYGVEEFVFLAMAVVVLLALGAGSVWYRVRTGRRDLHVVVKAPTPEVTARQEAVVELSVTNGGRRCRPPVLVEQARARWAVSFPGLGESSVAGARRVQATPSAAWLGAPRTRPDRHQRARTRRVLSGAQKLPDLPPGAVATLVIPVPSARRGLLTLSGLGVWCEDPFGLVARRVALSPPAHVIVYPEPASVPEEGRPRGAHGAGPRRSPAATRTTALSGDELSGLRAYEPGDRLTRLHWPSLARTGELVVREFVEPQAGSLLLLVDLRPSVHGADSVEKTISRAAGFGLGALSRGLTVELCTSTGERVVIAPNGAGRPTMLRALALLGPATAPPSVVRRWGDRPTGGAVWATGNPSGADVVLVTTPTGAAQRTLPDALVRQAETVLVP